MRPLHFLLALLFCAASLSQTTWANAPASASAAGHNEYKLGPNDALLIHVFLPEERTMDVVIAPDGYITYPFLGRIYASGKSVSEVETEIQEGLADGYLKYPVVGVHLKESRSQRFFVYGEVTEPGAFTLEPNMSVFKAIALAGGFTKFGSSSKVKIMRPREGAAGYEVIKVDIKQIVEGVADADVVLKSGDIVVVTEGIF